LLYDFTLKTFYLYTRCSFLTTKRESFSKFLAAPPLGDEQLARPGAINLPEDQLVGKKSGEKAGFCQFLSRLQAIKKGPL
jgi:hypothetical protein